jgi:transcriptional regulator with XRE-family HTH domain
MSGLSPDSFNGLALRMHRTLRGLTTGQLSDKLSQRGIKASAAAITRWELGDRKPQDLKIIRAIAKVLRCSTVALYRNPLLTYRTDGDGED